MQARNSAVTLVVRVRDALPRNDSGRIDTQRWQQLVCAEQPQLNPRSLGSILETLEGLDDVELLEAGIDLAQLLIELQLDPDSVFVGLVYRAWRFRRLDAAMVEGLVGEQGLGLARAVERLGRASHLPLEDDPVLSGGASEQIDNVRQLLESLIDDARVALIKLAERVVVLRLAKHLPTAEQRRLAEESQALFAPLAGRLGIWRLKWAIEDLAFRYLEPEIYQRVAGLLDGRREERELRIAELVVQLRSMLEAAGVLSEVSGRAKHIFSIWRKMQEKHLDVTEVYDVRALRVLVDTPADCYAALGAIHTAWKHLPAEFDDYIANPKDNGYQSIHTAVIGPFDQVLEVQIRTHLMHAEAEFGVCAHWSYKEPQREMSNDRIAWLRQLFEYYDDAGGEDGFETLLAQGFNDARIYCSTPQGHVLDLSQGSTAVDFAYRVHTAIGHRCRGAKVDGDFYPLDAPLHTGQRVKIITGETERPRREWLRRHLGYIRSNRARAKVQSWFRHQSDSANLVSGRRIWRETLGILGAPRDSPLPYERLDFANADELLVALGRTDLFVQDVARHLTLADVSPDAAVPVGEVARSGRGQIALGGQDWPLAFALCCRPHADEPIDGYLDETDAIVIHAADCTAHAARKRAHPVRVVKLDWQLPPSDHPLRIEVRGADRDGLLHDITRIMADESLSMGATQARLLENATLVSILIECQPVGLADLLRLLERLAAVKNVIDARRLT